MTQLEMDTILPARPRGGKKANTPPKGSSKQTKGKPKGTPAKKKSVPAARQQSKPQGKAPSSPGKVNGHAAPLVREAKKPPQPAKKSPATPARPKTKANQALVPQVMEPGAFSSAALTKHAYYADENALILHMEVGEALDLLASEGIQVNCIVTSPPFYGQRDYGVERQIGLEEHPSAFIANLADAFAKCRPVLAPNGSLWINIGDTYWSGKGEHKSGEAKQNARRFGLRPQDRKGDGKWCVPKQLLLLPHRLAIALQDQGWIVRNDNVWIKPNPIPDQVRDRCSLSHEYVFHFVKERWYFFDKDTVGRARDTGSVLPPLDTWQVPPVRGSAHHKARFSEDLVRTPILATTPLGGIVLDPFAGSGTSLIFARKHGFRAIGIDIKKEFCELMAQRLRDEAI